mgnify:CR=1 FL=1|jgi:hypothetical protein
MRQETGKEIETGTGKPRPAKRVRDLIEHGLRTRSRLYGYGVLFLAASCVVPYLVSGCGKKSTPRAPELALPVPIEDLRAKAEGKGIVLSWSRPKQYVDGKKLRELGGFVIFRKEVSAICPDCPTPYRQMTVIDVEDQEKFIQKQKFRFEDRELSSQTIYHYRVVSRLQDGSLSDPSNDAMLSWRP